jgi:hypothetical protein
MPKRSRYNTRRPASEARKQRIDQQQAILQRLREGGALSGAQPATPLATFGRTATIPDLYAAQKQDVPGGEILVSKELYSPETAELGPINTIGRTFYPAELQGNLVYVPGKAGGQYGKIFQQNASQTSLPPGAELGNVAPTIAPAPVKEDVGYKPQLAEYERIRKVAAETGDPEAIKQAEELGMAIFNAKYSEENPALIAGDRGVSYAGRLETNPLMEAATAADTAAQSFEQNYRKSLTDAAKEEGALLPTVNYQNFNTEVPDLFPKLPDGTSSIDPRFSQLNYTENLGYSPEELINLNYSMGAGQSTGTLPAQTSPEAYMDALDDAVLRSQDFMKQFAANRLGTSMGGE